MERTKRRITVLWRCKNIMAPCLCRPNTPRELYTLTMPIYIAYDSRAPQMFHSSVNEQFSLRALFSIRDHNLCIRSRIAIICTRRTTQRQCIQR